MSIEKINTDDFNKILFKHGRGKAGVVFKAILDLKVGEAIKIDKTEWKKRYHVSRKINYIRKNYGYQLTGGRMADGMGWAYKREK